MKVKSNKAEIEIDVCIWTENGFDYDYGIEWKTSCFDKIPEHVKIICGSEFYPEYHPGDEGFRYCPYCGKPIVINENIKKEEVREDDSQ